MDLRHRTRRAYHVYQRHFLRFCRRHEAAIAIGLSVLLILAGTFVVWLSTLQIPDLSAFETRKVSQSTKIYDRTGTVLLYDVNAGSRRTAIPLSEISPYVQKATIAIEDRDFYSHGGIDLTAIVRAVISDLIPGGVREGASTLTQQVIKNALLTRDQTITRKIKEWVLAIKLERIMTKDQILETYLNEAPYGGNMYGVEEASQTFFGKPAASDDIAEAAYLAAVLQAPTYYSPYGAHKDALDARQRLVLQKMKENGFLTDAEYKAALAESVQFLSKNLSGIRAPHFVMYVISQLVDRYGEDMVENGGLKVTTSLDYDIQQKAEDVISKFGPDLSKNFNASNTAMVAIDPKTGDILSMVGSRDYFDKSIDGNFNVATALRQPGSTFKPFVYATGFMEGYTPETELFDVPTQFSPQCNPDGTPKNAAASSTKICYSPVEYDKTYEGPMTARFALPQSRNIPAVQMLYLAGITDSISTAQSMGITSLTDPDRYGLTLVLGGAEVSLLELTSAYGVFANDGVRNPYRAIVKVQDGQGQTLQEASLDPVQAIPSQAARQINDILSDNSARMYSLKLLTDPLHRQIALKTGTTNDYRDVWTLGYTPDIAVGFWAGNNNNSPMNDAISTLIISPVWAAFMTEVNDLVPKNSFISPDPTPSDLKPTLRGIWQGGSSYFVDRFSGKLATPYTPQDARQEVVMPAVHTILQWVDKDDPRGPAPAVPSQDPQYDNWETAVQKWFADWQTTHGSLPQAAAQPTVSDDIHVPANFPKVSIASPAEGQFLDPNQLATVSFSSSGPYPVEKAELYVNNSYITSSSIAPFSLSFTPNDIGGLQASDVLKVVVYDNVLNQGSATVDFQTSAPAAATNAASSGEEDGTSTSQ